MVIRIIVIIMVAFSPLFAVYAAPDADLAMLDNAISRRDYYVQKKEKRIDSLENLAGKTKSLPQLIKIYNALYHEYLTYKFDKAIACIDRADRAIAATKDLNLINQAKIHRALSLATSGHFSNAISILDSINSHNLSPEIKDEYFSACEWTYGAWAEYAEKHRIAPELESKRILYLDSLLAITPKGTPLYHHRTADVAFHNKDYRRAERNYLAAIAAENPESRIYAQSTYGLASVYQALGDIPSYRKWLIKAAIADQTIPLKENLALQQLALFLETNEGDIKRANSYLKIALDDALFYNNRLRMLEIAEKMPKITEVYEDTISRQNSRLKLYLVIIFCLLLPIIIFILLIIRQRNKLRASHQELMILNDRLSKINSSLSHSNTAREQYLSLYIDLCITCIEKLNMLPATLKLKVSNISDLNAVAKHYIRPSEAELKEMFLNIDTAFLRIYPDFINEFNALLQEDKKIYPKKDELLNTDLRIYALVRLGITDSNKIASLLFLSAQTIYNHRSAIRNRAIDREGFENAVAGLCQFNPDLPADDSESTSE